MERPYSVNVELTVQLAIYSSTNETLPRMSAVVLCNRIRYGSQHPSRVDLLNRGSSSGDGSPQERTRRDGDYV